MIRKSMPEKGDQTVVKLYASENRFRHEVDNGKKLWSGVPAPLKQFLGVPYYGAQVATAQVKEFFGFNEKKGQVQKNRDTLKLETGNSVAFTVDQCEKALAQGGTREAMYMIVSPRYDMDLRTVLSKKSKADKVEALHKVFGVLAKLNEKLIHSDPFIDNVLFEKDEPRFIDFEYLRDSDTLYTRPEKRQPRFGMAELIVPETVAFTAAFESLSRVPNEVLAEERVAPVYHPKTKARDLAPRIDGYAYANPEGKTLTEWMRDGSTVELATLFPAEEVKAAYSNAIPLLAARFAATDATAIYSDAPMMAHMRARYDSFKLAMSIHLLDLESGSGIEPRDVLFTTRLLKGLTHPDTAQRLSAAEAEQWLETYLKYRPVAIKKAPTFAAQAALPLPRPGKAVTPDQIFAYSSPEVATEGEEKLLALAGAVKPAAKAAAEPKSVKPAKADAKKPAKPDAKKPAKAADPKTPAPAKAKPAAKKAAAVVVAPPTPAPVAVPTGVASPAPEAPAQEAAPVPTVVPVPTGTLPPQA